MHAPAARTALLRGMELMTALLRPTLGPVARTVAVAPVSGKGPPEILDSAATIARRTIQLADPFEDMGAMIVRHLAWRVFEQAGDGAATAAVLAQALAREATRYVAAGGSPAPIKQGIERGLSVAREELRRQAWTIELPAEIAAVAASTVRDRSLAEMIGEIVDSVGPDGAILFEETAEPRTGYEYVDGVRWNEGYASHFLLEPGQATARLLDPRIFTTDYPLESAEQLLPVLEACVGAGDRSLLVITPEIRDSALGLLVANRERGGLDGAIAVKAPSYGTQRTRILDDIAIATGGRCLHKDWGERLSDVTSDDLGRARQAWATRTSFGILGGQGSRDRIRERLAAARAELRAIGGDEQLRPIIRERIGKLAGTAAVIRVGGPAEGEQAELRLRLEAAVTAARSAVEDGVVPGGGAALLACVPSLEALRLAGDEAVGINILARALAEPMRVLARNAGLEPEPIVREARRRGPGWTFDLLRCEWVDARSAGLVDPLTVTTTALDASVSAATLALTSDVLVRRKSPPVAFEP